MMVTRLLPGVPQLYGDYEGRNIDCKLGQGKAEAFEHHDGISWEKKQNNKKRVTRVSVPNEIDMLHPQR